MSEVQSPSTSPQLGLGGGAPAMQQLSVSSPAAAPLDLITVKTCSVDAVLGPSACSEVVKSAQLQSQYRCYVQSDDDKFESDDFDSADMSCFEFGGFTIVDGTMHSHELVSCFLETWLTVHIFCSSSDWTECSVHRTVLEESDTHQSQFWSI